MELLRLILLYGHLIGFALLLGGAVVQYWTGPVRINAPMVWGALTQLVTGVALSAPLRDGDEPDPAKLVVKLVVALLIAVMVLVPRKRAQVNTGHFAGIVILTLVNAAVAVFW